MCLLNLFSHYVDEVKQTFLVLSLSFPFVTRCNYYHLTYALRSVDILVSTAWTSLKFANATKAISK